MAKCKPPRKIRARFAGCPSRMGAEMPRCHKSAYPLAKYNLAKYNNKNRHLDYQGGG